MLKTVARGLALVALLTCLLSCTPLPEPNVSGDKPVAIENLPVAGSIPAEWGDLVAVTVNPSFSYQYQLWFQDEQGNIYITGRKRLFINAGGNKVDPGQIEEVISRHPAVDEVVVVGVKGQYGQEIIKAVVVRNAGHQCTAEQIKEWCNGKLADFKTPRVVEFRAEIPRSPLGKILRKYLQEDVA